MKHIDFFDGEDCHDLHDSPPLAACLALMK